MSSTASDSRTTWPDSDEMIQQLVDGLESGDNDNAYAPRSWRHRLADRIERIGVWLSVKIWELAEWVRR